MFKLTQPIYHLDEQLPLHILSNKDIKKCDCGG